MKTAKRPNRELLGSAKLPTVTLAEPGVINAENRGSRNQRRLRDAGEMG